MWLGAGINNYQTAPFRVSNAGALVATNANITGAITATSGTFTGTVSGSAITGGTVSGSTITGVTVSGSTITGGTININSGTFFVTSNGALTATNANITGTITSSSGTIGGFSLSPSVLSASSGYTPLGEDTYININSNGLIESFYRNNGFLVGFYEHVKINNYAAGGNGAINVTGTASGFLSEYWYTSYGPFTPSDIRLKNLIDDNVDALSMIKNVQTTKFIMKNDENQKERFGFIAQQINDHIPYAAIQGGEDPEKQPWGIVQEVVIPYLVKSIQQLSTKIDELESRLV